MRHNILGAAVVSLTALASAVRAAPSAAELEQAGNLFSISCSSSFCHGEAGIGARGPSLRNRDFTPDFVRATMLEGRSGTPMPAFKDALSAAEVSMIVAYVMSLSPDNHAAASSVAPVLVQPATPPSAQAQAGAALFFGAPGCALCHSYGQKGGLVGPDLSAIAGKPPIEVYARMTKPAAANPDYPVVAVTTRDGVRTVGIAQRQDETGVRLYDLATAPPVLRSFYTADAARIESPAAATAPYRHDLAKLSPDQIAALIAFLKSAGGGPAADVTPRDFAQPSEREKP